MSLEDGDNEAIQEPMLEVRSIITLTPTTAIVEKLQVLCDEEFDIIEVELKQYLDKGGLEEHTIPVLAPLFKDVDQFDKFKEDNCATLIDMLLSSWPFDLHSWIFPHKNIELLNSLMTAHYFPFVVSYVAKPDDTLTKDIVTIIFSPTKELKEFIENNLTKKEPNADEFDKLQQLFAFGMVFLCDKLIRQNGLTDDDWEKYSHDPNNYFVTNKVNILSTLFRLFMSQQNDWPSELDNASLNKWFRAKVFVNGLYKLSEEK